MMIAWLLTRPLILSMLVAFASFSIAAVYDYTIDDPAVAAKARAGYVAIAEKTALEAQLLEAKRQARIAQDSASRFASEKQALDNQLLKQSEVNAERIKAYVEELRRTGNNCGYTDADREQLR